MEPPSVPRLRTWASPIIPAKSARAGTAPRTAADAATSAWRVIAPISTLSPTVMPAIPSMPPRSITSVGAARRAFNVGINVIPPAR